MKRSAGLAGAFVLILLSPALAGNPQKGKEIYETTCIPCHGPEGNAIIPGVPSFAKDEAIPGKGIKLSELSDEEVKRNISRGFKNPSTPGAPIMPPFGGGPPLSDGELEDLIAYIRNLAE